MNTILIGLVTQHGHYANELLLHLSLYIYLNQASNLSALMQSGGSVSDSAVKSALSGKVIKYTISMVTVIPILVVYPFMQRYFEKGIMLGAVKG